jgi:hypothetical protein
MRDVAGHEDQIDWAVAGDLIGNVDVAALGVLDIGDFHGPECPLGSSIVQRPKRWGNGDRTDCSSPNAHD